MVRRLGLLVVILALLAPAQVTAQTSGDGCPNAALLQVVPFAFETLTVTSSPAVPFTAATYAPAGVWPASVAELTIEASSIRYRVDGTAPTPLVGHHAGTVIRLYVCGTGSISRFQAILPNASNLVSAIVSVTYYRIQ